MIKILTVIDYSSQSERRLLKGLIEYADAHGGCILYPLSTFDVETAGHSEEIIQMARTLQVDAIYGVWYDIDVNAAKELGIPIFVRTNYRDYTDVSMATGDYQKIGRIAAEYFLRQHYEHYAFLGLKDILWSELRLDGFQSKVKEWMMDVHSYRAMSVTQEWAAISDWIQSLPKPIAMLTCNDAMAKRVTEICNTRGIRIPDELGLIGVDDDEFLCNISYPSISSIRLDFERQGREIAQGIFEMIQRKEVWVMRIPIEPIGIIERMSTLKRKISDPVVSHIINYMDANFTSEKCLHEAISTIHLSRRAIEIRFHKEMESQTMLSYLEQLRIEQLARLLRDTDLQIKEASARVGLGENTNVARLFKRYKGCTPSEFRRTMNKDTRKNRR